MDDISANWNYQIKYGYMPMNIVRKLIDTGELAYMNKTREAFTYPTETFNLPYTCKNIFHGCQLLAHLFIVGVYSPPPAHILKSQKCWGGCFLSISKRIPAMLRCSAPSTKVFT